MATSRKTRREGSRSAQLSAWIPNEEAARKWFEAVHFPGGELSCLRCGSGNVYRCKHKTMPFSCRSCKRYFSVKTGTAVEASNLPLKNWAWAIHIELSSPDGVSSRELSRDLGIHQETGGLYRWVQSRRHLFTVHRPGNPVSSPCSNGRHPRRPDVQCRIVVGVQTQSADHAAKASAFPVLLSRMPTATASL